MNSFATKIFANGAWSLSNQAVRVGSLALVTIALSRHFGPQRFGTLAVGLALVRIFALVANFGLDRVLVRHLVENDGAAAIVRRGGLLKLGTAVLSYVAMLIFIFTFERGDKLLFGIAALAGGGFLFQACDVFDYAFQAQNRFSLSFLGRAVPILLSTALKIDAILMDAPILFFAVLETVESALIGAALLLIYRRTGSRKLRESAPVIIAWRRLLGEGLPLLLGALAVMIYMRSDIVMLGKMIGYKAAGLYAAAAQISEACALLPMALMPVLFPTLVRWRRQGTKFYQHQFKRLFLGAATIGFVFSLILSLTAPQIMQLVFGPEYLPAAVVLVVHGWTIVFIFVGITQSAYDLTEGLTWFATFRTASGAVLNIALNLVLIPRYGLVGSAAATLVAQMFSSVLLNALHSRTRPILRMQLSSILIWPAFSAVYRDRRRHTPTGWHEVTNRVPVADG